MTWPLTTLFSLIVLFFAAFGGSDVVLRNIFPQSRWGYSWVLLEIVVRK